MNEINLNMVGGLSFTVQNIINENNYSTLILRVKNVGSSDGIVMLDKSNVLNRYISVEKGILPFHLVEPDGVSYYDGGYPIPKDSFLDIRILFKITGLKALDGDRFEIIFIDNVHFNFQYEHNGWFVENVENLKEKQLQNLKRLDSVVERFEALEEKLGIVLQNISVNIDAKQELTVFCEMMSLNGLNLQYDVKLLIIYYSIEGKIINMDEETIYSESFVGFQIVKFTVSLPFPIDNLGKIRIVPQKY
mgnify:CR=1 FL=1